MDRHKLAYLAAGLALIAGLGAARVDAQGAAPAAAAPAAAAPAPVTAPCPTPAEAALIAAAYAKSPQPMPFAAAPALKLPEVVVASGLPGELGRAVAGSHFRAVWDSLRAWPSATIMIRKGGNIFEVGSRVPGGEPSKRSSYFNLDHDFPISGHLRPDLLTAIEGVRLASGEGFVRGVFFYDGSGESVFGVFLQAEGAEPDAAAIAAFDKTWALLQSLPQRCPRGGG